MNFLKTSFLLAFLFLGITLFAQPKDPSPFDFGRMWTFENPPKDWFKEAYDFAPEDEWFDDVRKSSLRFASWCSASFVSPDGLIMTNHHCSRDEGIKAQQGNENFDKNGFYAVELADERKIEGLFVEQLIKVKDITEELKMATEGDSPEATQKAIEALEAQYANDVAWAELRLQVVNYYSGAKYSLYGYKRFDDIRLVCMPENSIGFYGGDPDNFTYPRYNLDFTFWRAYDSDGNPLNTSKHYFKFNPDGIEDGTTVFVVGNPGRTERYRTVAQLEFDRDHRYNSTLKFMNNRIAMMQEEYDEMSKDPAKEREAQELLGTITNFANGAKAYTGILGGLHNPDLFGRKVAMENLIKEKSPGINYWDRLDELYDGLNPHAWAINNLGPSPYRGKVLSLMHELYNYEMLTSNKGEDEAIATSKENILKLVQDCKAPKERKMFQMLMEEVSAAIPANNNSGVKKMSDAEVASFTEVIFDSAFFSDDVEKLIKKPKKLAKNNDPLLATTRKLIPAYNDAAVAFQSTGAERRGLEAKIANQAFEVYGDALPPDATFTLRISDGIVDGYDYNGTVAPYKTTFFGMYDRFYSNDEAYPWDLPEKWQNPSMELLQSPCNIVSTNDIIGGNSGSPLINKNKEAVGLIFDGNIESLPGNFIFDEEANRTVSVHAGGIFAALKYVYKAERLTKELAGEK